MSTRNDHRTARTAPSRRGLLAAAGLGAAGLTVGLAPSALAAPGSGYNRSISRTEVLSRARTWTGGTVATSVKYDNYATVSKPDGNVAWRTDCSGFASMCLKLRDAANPNGLSTGQFAQRPDILTKLARKADMKPGDVFLATAAQLGTRMGHIAVFEKWADSARTTAWIYEQTTDPQQDGSDVGPQYCIHHAVTWPTAMAAYAPYRYTRITD